MSAALRKPWNDAVFVEYVVAIREDFEFVSWIVVEDAYCAGGFVA